MKYNANERDSASAPSKRKRVGDYIAGGMERMLVSLMSGLCTLFVVNPEKLRRPGDRRNTPPSSGGISSLG